MTMHADQITIRAASDPVNGLSQARLGDEWWKLIYSIPASRHFGLADDATDPRGRRGSVEKALEARFDSATLFIGGGFGEIATHVGTDGVLRIERSILLPNDGQAMLFLPLLNSSFDNLVNDPDSEDNLTGDLTVDGLVRVQADLFDASADGGLVTSLFASVDGQIVSNPFAYRQASEAAFSYTAPYPVANGLLGRAGYTDDTYLDNAGARPVKLSQLASGRSVTIAPAVADGYWLAVDVAGGAHTLSFGGSLGPVASPFFALDTTYHVLNQVAGSRLADALTGTRTNDHVDGREGGDVLMGMGGDDLLLGGSGADVLRGGRGLDELWGDAGRDTFLFNRGDGNDTIFDFGSRETVVIAGLRAPVSITAIVLPSDVQATLVDFGRGDALTFVGLQSRDLLVQGGVIIGV